MNILVCLKQILDPEIPPRDFRIDAERLEAVQGSARLVTNIFCENALETALQLRDAAGGTITALTFGAPSAEDVLRKALALKIDHACLVSHDGPLRPCPTATARVLAAAAKMLGEFDLIMVGREAGDWGAGQTGGLLAEELGVPMVAFVDTIEAADPGVRLRRQTDWGWEQVAARLPLVVTITNNDENVPRIPKTRDIMTSSRKPLTTFKIADLDIDPDDLLPNSTDVTELFVPEKQVQCEFVQGDSLDEKVNAFAQRVVDALP